MITQFYDELQNAFILSLSDSEPCNMFNYNQVSSWLNAIELSSRSANHIKSTNMESVSKFLGSDRNRGIISIASTLLSFKEFRRNWQIQEELPVTA